MKLLSPKQLIVLATILLSTIGVNLCFVLPPPSAPEQYSDINVCRQCHQSITDSFMRTAHFLDSRPADSSYIKGSFKEGENIFSYNPFMEVHMVNDGGRFWQVGLVNGTETVAAPFDIVIGSGRNGQTYFTWSGNQLFQLPVSYYVPAKLWCNSPGFPNYFFFGRKVPPNCLECHATYAKVTSQEQLTYDLNSIVYGITCERCHPRAVEHAAFHMANPDEKQPKFVVSTQRMSKQLRMDACALCHSGFRNALKPPFSFVVGDTLDKFSVGETVSARADTLDVHGNQVGLLKLSKCYIRSNTMDCSTCHDVHTNEYGNRKLFSQKCLTCHSNSNNDNAHMLCTLTGSNNVVVEENCIDCHMPKLASKNIQLDVNNKDELMPDYLHTHFISIYKEESEKFMKMNVKRKRK